MNFLLTNSSARIQNPRMNAKREGKASPYLSLRLSPYAVCGAEELCLVLMVTRFELCVLLEASVMRLLNLRILLSRLAIRLFPHRLDK